MTYINNAQIWKPKVQTLTLTVLVPGNLRQIDSEAQYLTLLEQRLHWLLEQWMTDAPHSRAETHTMMMQVLSALNPATESQPIYQETNDKAALAQWQQDWVTTLIHQSGAIQALLMVEEETFPQPIPPASDTQNLYSLFQAPVPYSLEEWLYDLLHLSTQ